MTPSGLSKQSISQFVACCEQWWWPNDPASSYMAQATEEYDNTLVKIMTQALVSIYKFHTQNSRCNVFISILISSDQLCIRVY